MNKKTVISLIFLVLTGCVSEQERNESRYMYEQALLDQCQHILGFQKGTQNYMNCRMFYNSYFKTLGYDMAYPSYSKANKVQRDIQRVNSQCTYFWGTDEVTKVNKVALWSCTQKIVQEEMDEIKHQKELEEKQKMLTDSIAEGQKKANDNARLQERINAERERVAASTGKSPSKIKCKTYTKSNGYIQVKCK